MTDTTPPDPSTIVDVLPWAQSLSQNDQEAIVRDLSAASGTGAGNLIQVLKEWKATAENERA